MLTLDEMFDSVFEKIFNKAADMAIDGAVNRGFKGKPASAGGGNNTSSHRGSPPAIDLDQVKRATWGPERIIVNANDPYGYTPTASFNCDYNNPNYGDERVIVTSKITTHMTAGNWDVRVEVAVGNEYWLRVNYHNSASPDHVALNSRVRFNIPTERATTALVTAFLSADNTEPTVVWSHLIFESPTPFQLAYVPGSAHITNNKHTAGIPSGDGAALPGGELIGDDGLGVVPGGYQSTGGFFCKVRAV